MSTPLWAVGPILVPLVLAIAAAVTGRRGGPVLATVAAAGVPLAVAGLILQVTGEGVRPVPMGGWDAPLGIALNPDGLALLMLAVTGAVGATTSLYATAYFRGRPDRWFWALWLFLWAALNALFLSDDIFNLYVTLELLGLAAVALVALGGTARAVAAGMRYLLVSMVGSLLLLLGVALLYTGFGTLSVSVLAEVAEPAPHLWTALVLMSVGMFMKTALFPLHGWLPPAHSAAPAPASAILSGLVVKASFYVLLRLWFTLFPLAGSGPEGAPGGPPPEAALLVMGALGAAAVLWGSIMALRQRRVKLLVAYSTVGQIGYLFLLFPLVAAGVSQAWIVAGWEGGIYHIIAHACAKAAMFLAAGSMMYAAGDDALPSLAGIGHRLPLSFSAFGLGGLSLTGMPPSGGFVAKWLLLSAALGAGRWVWALVIVVGSLLAAGYVFLVLRYAFQRTEAPAPERLRPVPRTMELTALALALLGVALGIWATWPLALLGTGGFPFVAAVR